MRRTAVETAALAVLLLGGALAWGQPATPPAQEKPKEEPAKSKLEEMLQKALQDNPDVRLAAAKVAEAEAELNRARLLVVQKVAALYQAVEAQKAAVDGAAAELEETRTLFKSGTAAQGTLRDAEQKLLDAKAKLAGLEAEMPYLLGQQAAGVDAKMGAAWRDFLKKPSGGADAEMTRRFYLDLYGRLPTAEELAAGIPAGPSVQGPIADRLRAALDKPFTYDCKDKAVAEALRDMNKAFQEANPGLVIRDNTSVGDETAVSAHFDRMPFGAALEWIEDSASSNYGVAVRDYGVVIGPKEQMPPGAPSLHDFWKGGKVEAKAAPPPKTPIGVEGKVTGFRPGGLVVLDIGSDAGVGKGDDLEAYQPGKDPGTDEKMGILRVTEATAKESVAQLVSAFPTVPQQGWRVVRIEREK